MFAHGIYQQSATMSLEFSQFPLSSLPVGAVLTAPIYDSGSVNTKLLGENIEINEVFLAQLEARGITSISLSKRDLASLSAGLPQGVRREASDHVYTPSSLSTEHSEELDQDIASQQFSTEPGEKVDRQLASPDGTYDRDAMDAETRNREHQVAYVENLFAKLMKGDGTDADALSDLCRSSVQSVVRDKDLFLCLGINPFDGDYPSRHSLHVSSVAISIGVIMGLDDDSLVDLGTGCLIHDVGMLKLDKNLYKSKRKLGSKELCTLSEHPILTMDALACPGVRLSRIARIVAYQIHERCNGTGYPRGAIKDDLHILSRVASVADAYVGLVSNRWHRRGLMPYHAMVKMLSDVSIGLFDAKVVRALLNAVSLFPIGSFVEMQEGRIGRVVRSTGETYTKPIIELWSEKHGEFESDLINLAEESELEIRRAIAKGPTEAVR